MTERTLTITDNPAEYTNLMRAVGIMNALETSHSIYYDLRDCYLDYGIKWMWTTIIAHDTEATGVCSSWQAINPKQWKQIVACTSNQELLEVMKTVIK